MHNNSNMQISKWKEIDANFYNFSKFRELMPEKCHLSLISRLTLKEILLLLLLLSLLLLIIIIIIIVIIVIIITIIVITITIIIVVIVIISIAIIIISWCSNIIIPKPYQLFTAGAATEIGSVCVDRGIEAIHRCVDFDTAGNCREFRPTFWMTSSGQQMMIWNLEVWKIACVILSPAQCLLMTLHHQAVMTKFGLRIYMGHTLEGLYGGM